MKRSSLLISSVVLALIILFFYQKRNKSTEIVGEKVLAMANESVIKGMDPGQKGDATPNSNYDKQKHVLFIVECGSHLNPTIPLVKSLIDQGAKVTYMTIDGSKQRKESLNKLGATILDYVSEIESVNPNLNSQQKEAIKIGLSDCGLADDKKHGGDSHLKMFYITALFWNEWLAIAKKINPDVIIYDKAQAVWGKYIGRSLNIPTIASCPCEFEPFWHDENSDGVRNYYRHEYPPTAKREWAVKFLKEKLGTKIFDVNDANDANGVYVFSDYANLYYTYPKFQGYLGENSHGYNLLFIKRTYEERTLSDSDHKLLQQCKMATESGKSLIFVSMGTAVSQPIEFFETLAGVLGNGGGNKKINKDIVIAVHSGNAFDGDKRIKAKDIERRLEKLGHTNFIIKDYFPLPELFKITDVFLSHSGQNSVFEALEYNVPMVLMPITSGQYDLNRRIKELDFPLAVTVPAYLNIAKFELDQKKWNEFERSSTKKAAFNKWLSESVKTSLNQAKSADFLLKRKQFIDSLTSDGVIEYEEAAKIILKVKAKPEKTKE